MNGTIYKYKPSRYIKKRVKEFARSRITISKNLYKFRGEKNINKMVSDIEVGTVGEYAIRDYIKKELFFPAPSQTLSYTRLKTSHIAPI